MAIVTISRQIGSFGEELAEALAGRLDYRVIDRADIATRLAASGLPEKQWGETFAEEKEPSLLHTFVLNRDKLVYYIKKILYDIAQNDQIIILGMGAQVIFEHFPQTLHTMIIAPRDLRITRVKAQSGCSDQYAEHLVHDSDHARARFNKYFFNVDWESALLYDLTLNTDTIPLDDLTTLLQQAVQELEKRKQPAGDSLPQRLNDLSLEQQVYIRILYEKKIDPLHLNVTVQDRIVTLGGYIRKASDRERCEAVARELPGVQDVINNIFTEPPFARQ